MGSTEEEFYEDINNNGRSMMKVTMVGFGMIVGIDGFVQVTPYVDSQDVGEGDGIFNVAMDEGEFNGIWDEGNYFMMQMEMGHGQLMN